MPFSSDVSGAMVEASRRDVVFTHHAKSHKMNNYDVFDLKQR
jgi:hypothetical protein